LYEDIEERIQSNYEKVRNEMLVNPISARIVQKQFNKERYLGYYDLDSLIVVFNVNSQIISIIKIPKDGTLIDKTNLFKKILSSPPHKLYGAIQVDEFSELSSYLFIKLLKPALNNLNEKALSIHPDGILLGFPFEALTLYCTTVNSFKSLPYVMDHYKIRYLSTSQLVRSNCTDFVNKDSISIITCRDASNIPEVENEVTGIAQEYRHPSVLYLNDRKPNTYNLKKSMILHISSHLFVDNQVPLNSGIFCQVADSQGLKFKDIMNFQMSGTQVFINACESGNGPLNHGEGLMSLGLAFSIAGCSTIIEQIWKAPDYTSSQIAQSYYRYLGKYSPADALNRAKKDYVMYSKKGSDHPFYWAGVICYTNIASKAKFPCIPVLFLIFLGIEGCFYWWFLRNRNFR
jgi:CHAT domain-containing protein